MKQETEISSTSDLEVKYGLPRKVKFCKICCITNQRPCSVNEYSHAPDSKKRTIVFDQEGICAACRNKEKQHREIDWSQRDKQLRHLCDRFRRNDGHYDCIVPGSGGKDSVFASHILKYKYGMHPLTVTWAPHMYTDIGWKNFQNWLHKGGFDNYLLTPNGRVHRLLTRLAVINLLHPFQPFILGQKTFVAKMCAMFNVPLAFYGEMPGEYGTAEGMPLGNEMKFADTAGSGFSKDMIGGRDIQDLYLGGSQVRELLDRYKLHPNDLSAYFPLDYATFVEKKIEIYYLGYFVKWDPQECYYFAVENTGFEANPVRTEGTYSKYNSLDDKIDGFFYYTSYIKFGMGRAMQDASQEIRNKKITTEEGKALIKKYDGEFPARYYKEFLEYTGLIDQEFKDLCDKFRSPHLWAKVNGEWKLRHAVNQDGVDD